MSCKLHFVPEKKKELEILFQYPSLEVICSEQKPMYIKH